MRLVRLVCTLAVLAAWNCPAAAQIPSNLTYQGVLTDTSGVPVVDGLHEITFSLHAGPTVVTPLWLETHAAVPTTNGAFTVVLGSIAPLNIGFDAPRYLGVSVDGGAEMVPRPPLTAVPYARMAAAVQDGIVGTTALTDSSVTTDKIGRNAVRSDRILDGSIVAQDLADGAVTTEKIAEGAVSADKLAGGAVVNASLSDGSITGIKIAADQILRSINGITDEMVLAAGSNVTITPNGSTLTIASTAGGGGGGGAVNSVSGLTGDVTLVAGSNVTITPSGSSLTIASSAAGGNSLDGAYDQGGAGVGRVITADAGAVEVIGVDGFLTTGTFGSGAIPATGAGVRMMWYPNKAAFRAGEVSGTHWNDANVGSRSTVAGGQNGHASGDHSAILGGTNNTATGNWTTVGGGVSNTAAGDYSSIVGGNLGSTSADFTAVGGGHTNIASGLGSTVPGGWLNEAAGAYSFAAGRRAKANHDGAFVWADQTDADFASTAVDQFLIQAAGGVGISTDTPSEKLHVIGNILAQGNITSWDGTNSLAIAAAGDLTASGNPVDISRTGAASMRVNSDITFSPFGTTDAVVFEQTTGDVGIGIANPTQRLHVDGAVMIPKDRAYRFDNSGTPVYMMGSGGGAGAEWLGLAIPSGAGEIRFFGASGAGDEKMRIEANGNVGIGTAIPTVPLHVARATDGDGLFLQHTGASGKHLNFSLTTTTNSITSSGNLTLHANGTNDVVLMANSTEGLRLTSAGLLGIGTTSPAAGRRITVKASSDNNMEIILQKHDSSHELVRIGEQSLSGVIGIYDFTSNSFNHWLEGANGSHSSLAVQPNARVGIGISTPAAKLEVEGGAVLFDGTTGGTPVSGARTRLIWIPAKSALRVGVVTSTQFDDANIGVESSVAGGRNNIGSGEKSAIGGGVGNVASAVSTSIGGGNGNQATADYSTTAGGQTNTASGINASVGGGGTNTAAAQYGTISGGVSNQVQVGGNWGSVGGGSNNIVSGIRGTVPGGEQNEAAGARSFAAGLRAKANHDGAFVWGDGSAFDFASTAADEFSARAVGGARFVSAIDGSGNATAGVTLASGGGSWSSISDSTTKEHVTAVDARDIADRVAALPMATWNYKSQADSIRHMGPMAQDFHAAFGLGGDKRRIATIDADGVALAAIQGLHATLQDQARQIDSLEGRNADLETRLARLERLLTARSAAAVRQRRG